MSAGGWCSESAAGEQWGGEKGAVCRTACAKNRQSAACVLPAPPESPRCLSGHRVPADVVTRTPSVLSSLSPGRCSYKKSIRLEASGDYPPNLSISLSGGKEINRDLLSSGERTGASPALNRGSAHAGREMWGEGLPAHPRGRGRAPHVEASARRPRTPHQRG